MTENNPKYEAGFGSDAKKDPVRVVFVTKKTSAKVIGDPGPQVMSYPHLLIREAIAFMVLVIGLVCVALFWDAPLEQLANPLLTPNPAKAPWYFLGLQELLHYFPPLVAGIIIPTLVVIGLIVIPYFNVNVQGRPVWAANRKRALSIFLVAVLALTSMLVLTHAWTVLVPTEAVAGLMLYAYVTSGRDGAASGYLQTRPVSWWVMTWFITVAIVLTAVGTIFRGPGWSWVWPWSSHAG
jgi:cytochrome b/b6/petD-like protein